MKKIYDQIVDMKGNLLSVMAPNVGLGEMTEIYKKNGETTKASVLRIEKEKVTLQAFENTRGLATDDRLCFLNKEMQVTTGTATLGRCFNGSGEVIDKGPVPLGKKVNINSPSINPVKRSMPHELVRTNIPMIDMFNCLVRSQKIPVFSVAGEPYNKLLMRIANQTDADVIVIGGMGLRFDDYHAFIQNAQASGSLEKTVMFIHQAVDPVVECLLVPDMALASAQEFALEGKNVLVLLTDMSAFADAIKEISITMDQVPSNRGYPGSLYSDLALRYERAASFEGSGTVTIISALTMPGNDVTAPHPDNTGYITEGQLQLQKGKIEIFGSLSRLKQQVIGKVTREDHGDLANNMVRLYADSKKASERYSMGFKISKWDTKLLKYSQLFEERMMSLDVDLLLEDALNLGWEILAECFEKEEVGMKEALVSKYWPIG